MRALTTLLIALLLAASSPATAGMRLTLVMVPPEQVKALSKDEQALTNLLTDVHPDSGLELDKEWHGLHYLLNGNQWSTDGPYGLVILGGSEIGPDLGYGPARVLTPIKVANIASILGTMSVDELQRRYDPKAMDDAAIYPEVWRRDGVGALHWLLIGYRKLVEFYSRAASQGKAVVLAVL